MQSTVAPIGAALSDWDPDPIEHRENADKPAPARQGQPPFRAARLGLNTFRRPVSPGRFGTGLTSGSHVAAEKGIQSPFSRLFRIPGFLVGCWGLRHGRFQGMTRAFDRINEKGLRPIRSPVSSVASITAARFAVSLAKVARPRARLHRFPRTRERKAATTNAWVKQEVA